MQEENTDKLDEFKFRLGRCADEAKLSQVEIAARMGIKPARVGNWFQGRHLPAQRQLIALAKLLGTTTEWLLDGSGPISSESVFQEEQAAYGVTVRAVPLVSWAHAGEAVSYEEIPKHARGSVSSMSRDKRAFALTIEGDSMEPKFLPGDRVILEPSRPPINGKAVIAKFADDAVQLRIYQKLSGGKIRLAPLNTVYAATEHTLDEFNWIFPVVELSRPV